MAIVPEERIQPVRPPAIPDSVDTSRPASFRQFTNVLKLYFSRLSYSFNALSGLFGGRFLESPNGAFYHTSTQTAAVINTTYQVSFGTNYLANGVSIANSSEITVTYSGVYSVNFVLNVTSNTAATKTVWFWLSRNGTDVGKTSFSTTLSASGEDKSVTLNYVIDIPGGGNVELNWAVDSTDLVLEAENTTSPHKGKPSSYCTITYVSAAPETLPTLPST